MHFVVWLVKQAHLSQFQLNYTAIKLLSYTDNFVILTVHSLYGSWTSKESVQLSIQDIIFFLSLLSYTCMTLHILKAFNVKNVSSLDISVSDLT